MTASHTNVLELLGKQVSFTRKLESGLHVLFLNYSGTVTEIVISLTSEPQISIDHGEFFILSELLKFKTF
jgi:hypothetical protein